MFDHFWAGFASGVLLYLILDNGARMLYAWWQVHGRTPVCRARMSRMTKMMRLTIGRSPRRT